MHGLHYFRPWGLNLLQMEGGLMKIDYRKGLLGDGENRSNIASGGFLSIFMIGDLLVCGGESSNLVMRWRGSFSDVDTSVGVANCFSDISMSFFT